jgi:hypothetical protein
MGSWEFNKEIRERVFYRAVGYKARQPDDEKEIGFFLERFLSDQNGIEDVNKICKLFGVSKNPQELQKLPLSKLFAFLNACCMNIYDVPDADDIGKPNDFIKWAGVPKERLKLMYREEIGTLMPEVKATGKTKAGKGKKEKGKKAKKKAGAVDIPGGIEPVIPADDMEAAG